MATPTAPYRCYVVEECTSGYDVHRQYAVITYEETDYGREAVASSRVYGGVTGKKKLDALARRLNAEARA